MKQRVNWLRKLQMAKQGEGSEVRGARAAIKEVRSRIQCRQNSVVKDIIDEKNEAFFIAKMKKTQICFGK
jgi:hypothetical protein